MSHFIEDPDENCMESGKVAVKVNLFIHIESLRRTSKKLNTGFFFLNHG